ncbi:hypothetical protein CYMTET_55009 [Cymbomonas tetramitiformis]|uniref:Uncharacterized protein n=1 Tax=Cymbomonas tetramitiformis TaxID=36881 RepID=A0AAE0BFK8_9CHLO|nr:hypothetical protein CYMTET_55009 [Cymbomonas tetramitiformis]
MVRWFGRTRRACFRCISKILNLPAEQIRGKYEYLDVYGILQGTRPADTTLPYDKLVTELKELWETGFDVWDSFSEEIVHLRCMLLGVIMDYKGLVDAVKRLDVGDKKSCMKCPLRALHSRALSKSIYAFYKQNDGMDFDDKVRNFAEEESVHPERYRTEWVKKSDGEL